MRRLIGLVGVGVVVIVAVIALLRDQPASATSPPSSASSVRAPSPIDAQAERSAPTPPSTAESTSESNVATKAIVPPPTAPVATSSAPPGTAKTTKPAAAGAPVRGLVMKPDEQPRSPGADVTMTKEAIQSAIKAVTPRVQHCYESALEQNPDLAGTVKLNFTLQAGDDGKGVVTEGEVADSETQSPFFEACVLKEVAGAAFDAPAGGGTVTVTYPFRFSTSDDAAPKTK